MQRKIKAIDPKELFDADDINRTSIKGEMRKLYPAIHQKLKEGGWSARDIVAWMDVRGISMTVELFRVYLNNLDRENGYARSVDKLTNAINTTKINTEKPAPPSVRKPTAPPAAPAVPRKPITGDDIKNSLRGPINLKQYD